MKCKTCTSDLDYVLPELWFCPSCWECLGESPNWSLEESAGGNDLEAQIELQIKEWKAEFLDSKNSA
jgi:hypothetical protein